MKLVLRSISPLFIFAALTVLFFPDIFLYGKVYIAKTGDFHLANYSMAHFFKESVYTGVWPLWNTLSFCGYPFGAAALSNVNLTYLLAILSNSIPFAWNATILISVFLATFCTYGYLVKIGLDFFSSVMAAIIFAFTPSGGNFVDSWGFFLPLALWMVEEYFTSRKVRYAAAVVLAFALYFLNVLPQYALYSGAFFALYVGIRFRSFAGIYLPALALGMVSFYTFRLFEALSLSPRGHLWFMNVILPTHLMNVVFPWIFESPFRQESNFFFAKIFYAATRALFRTDNIIYLAPPYVGIAGFVFFIFSWKAKGIARIYLGTTVFILLYMMTFPIFSPLYRNIPILAQLPRIARLESLFCFCLAVLAGMGVQRVLKENPSPHPLFLFFAALSAMVVGTLTALRLALRWKSETLQTSVMNYIETHVIGQPQYQAPPDFYRARVDEFFIFLKEWTNLGSPSVLLPLFFILAVCISLALWHKHAISGRFFSYLVGGLLVLDLLIYFRSTQYYMSLPGELKISSPIIDFLREDKELFRVMPILEPAEFGVGRVRGFLAPNANLLYGLGSVEGWDAFLPRRYGEFFKTFQKNYDNDPALVMGGAEGDFDYRMLDFLNVKYFLTLKSGVLDRDMPVAAEDDTHKLYFNKFYLPRAFLVSEYRVLKNDKQILDYLKSDAMAFDKTVVLEENPVSITFPTTGQTQERSAVFTRYTPHEVGIEIKTPENVFLVLTDNYYPGWKAMLDGSPEKIYRANYSFRAVPIPAGRHAVRFYYDPASFRMGLVASLIFLVAGGLFLLYLTATKKEAF